MAAPLNSHLTTQSDVVHVRSNGGAVAAGAAVGLIGGLAIGSAINNNRNDGYYDNGYYAPQRSYYVAPAPRYRRYEPVYDRYQQCYVDRNGYCID